MLLSSCASFSKETINPNVLNTSNLKEIEGTYAVQANEVVRSEYGDFRESFYNYLHLNLRKHSSLADTTVVQSFEIDVIDDRKMKIRFNTATRSLYEFDIKYKLRKDGFVHLKYKNVKLIGAPYIAGRFDFKRTRLTTLPNGDLFVQGANQNSGAFMIIVFLNSSVRRNQNHFKRIE
ncbi:hypothetical protein GCM10011344_29270 [Dokdonia pacifica]|nr:hypothetical protein GCM10011344_29270 [Dokdonia pacifica]